MQVLCPALSVRIREKQDCCHHHVTLLNHRYRLQENLQNVLQQDSYKISIVLFNFKLHQLEFKFEIEVASVTERRKRVDWKVLKII